MASSSSLSGCSCLEDWEASEETLQTSLGALWSNASLLRGGGHGEPEVEVRFRADRSLYASLSSASAPSTFLADCCRSQGPQFQADAEGCEVLYPLTLAFACLSLALFAGFWRLRHKQPMKSRQLGPTALIVGLQLFFVGLRTYNMCAAHASGSVAADVFSRVLLLPAILLYYQVRQVQLLYTFAWSAMKNAAAHSKEHLAQLHVLQKLRPVLSDKAYGIAVSVLMLILVACLLPLTVGNADASNVFSGKDGTDTLLSTMRCSWFQIPEEARHARTPAWSGSPYQDGGPMCECVDYLWVENRRGLDQCTDGLDALSFFCNATAATQPDCNVSAAALASPPAGQYVPEAGTFEYTKSCELCAACPSNSALDDEEQAQNCAVPWIRENYYAAQGCTMPAETPTLFWCVTGVDASRPLSYFVVVVSALQLFILLLLSACALYTRDQFGMSVEFCVVTAGFIAARAISAVARFVGSFCGARGGSTTIDLDDLEGRDAILSYVNAEIFLSVSVVWGATVTLGLPIVLFYRRRAVLVERRVPGHANALKNRNQAKKTGRQHEGMLSTVRHSWGGLYPRGGDTDTGNMPPRPYGYGEDVHLDELHGSVIATDQDSGGDGAGDESTAAEEDFSDVNDDSGHEEKDGRGTSRKRQRRRRRRRRKPTNKAIPTGPSQLLDALKRTARGPTNLSGAAGLHSQSDDEGRRPNLFRRSSSWQVVQIAVGAGHSPAAQHASRNVMNWAEAELLYCLQNELASNVYKQYAVEEFTSENILFLLATLDLMDYPVVDLQWLNTAKDHYDKYICAGAPLEVNISMKQKHRVEFALARLMRSARLASSIVSMSAGDRDSDGPIREIGQAMETISTFGESAGDPANPPSPPKLPRRMTRGSEASTDGDGATSSGRSTARGHIASFIGHLTNPRRRSAPFSREQHQEQPQAAPKRIPTDTNPADRLSALTPSSLDRGTGGAGTGSYVVERPTAKAQGRASLGRRLSPKNTPAAPVGAPPSQSAIDAVDNASSATAAAMVTMNGSSNSSGNDKDNDNSYGSPHAPNVGGPPTLYTPPPALLPAAPAAVGRKLTFELTSSGGSPSTGVADDGSWSGHSHTANTIAHDCSTPEHHHEQPQYRDEFVTPNHNGIELQPFEAAAAAEAAADTPQRVVIPAELLAQGERAAKINATRPGMEPLSPLSNRLPMSGLAGSAQRRKRGRSTTTTAVPSHLHQKSKGGAGTLGLQPAPANLQLPRIQRKYSFTPRPGSATERPESPGGHSNEDEGSIQSLGQFTGGRRLRTYSNLSSSESRPSTAGTPVRLSRTEPRDSTTSAASAVSGTGVGEPGTPTTGRSRSRTRSTAAGKKGYGSLASAVFAAAATTGQHATRARLARSGSVIAESPPVSPDLNFSGRKMSSVMARSSPKLGMRHNLRGNSSVMVRKQARGSGTEDLSPVRSTTRRATAPPQQRFPPMDDGELGPRAADSPAHGHGHRERDGDGNGDGSDAQIGPPLGTPGGSTLASSGTSVAGGGKTRGTRTNLDVRRQHVRVDSISTPVVATRRPDKDTPPPPSAGGSGGITPPLSCEPRHQTRPASALTPPMLGQWASPIPGPSRETTTESSHGERPTGRDSVGIVTPRSEVVQSGRGSPSPEQDSPMPPVQFANGAGIGEPSAMNSPTIGPPAVAFDGTTIQCHVDCDGADADADAEAATTAASAAEAADEASLFMQTRKRHSTIYEVGSEPASEVASPDGSPHPSFSAADKAVDPTTVLHSLQATSGDLRGIAPRSDAVPLDDTSPSFAANREVQVATTTIGGGNTGKEGKAEAGAEGEDDPSRAPSGRFDKFGPAATMPNQTSPDEAVMEYCNAINDVFQEVRTLVLQDSWVNFAASAYYREFYELYRADRKVRLLMGDDNEPQSASHV